MSKINEDSCPLSLPVPISVTVNTSGSCPAPTSKLHSLSATNSGYTGISKFTFAPMLTGTALSIQDYFRPDLSITTALWDFGDGYTREGTTDYIPTHEYQVPGIYTATVFFYDKDGNTYINTFTESISVYNYANTHLELDSRGTSLCSTSAEFSSMFGRSIYAGNKEDFQKSLKLGVSASWQDIPKEDEPFTLYFTASGSKAKPYDSSNKYAHLIPYNAFYDEDLNRIGSDGLDVANKLFPHYYAINPDGNTIHEIQEKYIQVFKDRDIDVIKLYASTGRPSGAYEIRESTASPAVTSFYPPSRIDKDNGILFSYYDDIPNTRVNLLVRLDTSKHKLKHFYVDKIDSDINTSGLNHLETNVAGLNVSGTTRIGLQLRIIEPTIDRFSFTSTGMKEMSALDYKRHKNKFQVFISAADENSNVLKHLPVFKFTTDPVTSNWTDNYIFYVDWTSGGDASNIGATTHTSNISSISTNKFPYNSTTGKTELSSFLYTNIDPISTGTWTLNITGKIDSLITQPDSNIGDGCIGDGNAGNMGDGYGSANVTGKMLTGQYTFTISPSTNDVEIYKINEDIDYSQVLKSYRFQSFLHEYDKLFDGVFTSFVGSASSSPTTFGKTIFEKISNFVSNNSDIDFCKIENIQAFYDFFNEDIDFIAPDPPPELKRLYNLFSIKISKLLGHYEQINDSFDTKFYTSSADSRNINFTSPIVASTYTVSANSPFVARQKFNNEFVLIKPQKVASTQVYDERTTVDPVLLIRGNVGVGSSFSDSSTSTTTHTMTANRNATHSTTQSKFNGGSIKFDGDDNNANADYIKLDGHDDFVFGTDDFTIDCWMYGDSFADYEAVFSHGCKTNNNMLHALEVTADAAVRWLIRATGTGGTETIDMRTPNGTISTDTWHHIAAVRSGAYFYIFIDGVLQAKSDEDAQPWPINTGSNQGGYTTRSSTGNYWYDPANGPADLVELVSTGGDKKPVYIGARVRNPSSNIDGMHGYLDEFRITRTALWTANFTPPTTRGASTADSTYPLSSYNVYSNWGWKLDTSVSGASGLDHFYEFYPYTVYNTVSAKHIKNSIIDFTNPYTTLSRSTSSLSASWENDGGIIYKNLDYQIRKGLSL